MKASEVDADRGRFRKGRSKTGGRRKGSPNKATRAWKDFVTGLVNDPKQQQALADAIKARPELLFKAAEHAVGKPAQAVEMEQAGTLEVRWMEDPLISRLEAGRKRVAAAKVAGSSGDAR